MQWSFSALCRIFQKNICLQRALTTKCWQITGEQHMINSKGTSQQQQAVTSRYCPSASLHSSSSIGETHTVQFHHMGTRHTSKCITGQFIRIVLLDKTVRFIITGLLFSGWRKFNKSYSKSKQTCCMFFRFAFQSQTLGLQNWHLLFPV